MKHLSRFIGLAGLCLLLAMTLLAFFQGDFPPTSSQTFYQYELTHGDTMVIDLTDSITTSNDTLLFLHPLDTLPAHLSVDGAGRLITSDFLQVGKDSIRFVACQVADPSCLTYSSDKCQSKEVKINFVYVGSVDSVEVAFFQEPGCNPLSCYDNINFGDTLSFSGSAPINKVQVFIKDTLASSDTLACSDLDLDCDMTDFEMKTSCGHLQKIAGTVVEEQLLVYSIVTANKNHLDTIAPDGDGETTFPVYCSDTFTVCINVQDRTLPISLLSFEPAVSSDMVELFWEISNAEYALFSVEKSYEEDFEDSEVISLLEGNAGETSFRFNYVEAKGSHFVRLKMVDADGEYSYSPIRSVFVEKGPIAPEVWPNPFVDELHIQYQTNLEVAELNLYNATGRLIRSLPLNSLNTRTIELTDLTQGVYFLQVVDGLESYTHRLIKL